MGGGREKGKNATEASEYNDNLSLFSSTATKAGSEGVLSVVITGLL